MSKLLFENVRMKKEWQDIIVNTLQEINPKLKDVHNQFIYRICTE